MNKTLVKILKVSLLSIFLTLFLTSCSTSVKDIVSINYKNLAGTNSFHSLVNTLVEKQEDKLKMNISSDEVVLVSDFVNLDKLKNRSKLGFLLSEHLKDSLSNRNIIVREVELSRDFEFGKTGFNVLTRKQKDMSKKEVSEKFAVVGTYSITTQSLIVFVKLIDITNGNILSSASGSTLLDNEIKELESIPQQRANVIAPVVL